MKIRSKIAVFSALPLFLLSACASGADTGNNGSENSADSPLEFVKKEPLKLGYSVYDLQNSYWQSYAEGVKAGAKEAGVEVSIVDQKSEQAKQVSGSLDLINSGISGLIITPVQPSALPSTIDAAHAEKIPVVIGDIGTGGNYDVYIQSNNKNGGELAAKYLIDRFKDTDGKHKIGVIELHAGSVVGEERVSGFKDAIAKSDNLEVVASLDGNDTVDGGFSAAQDMLSANPDLEVIYAANDDSAIGAQRAMETAGKSVADGFVLIGFDGSPSALDLIRSGKMSATVAQDPYGQGKKAVETILAILDGKSPEFDDSKTKTIFFPVTMVDSSSLDQFLASKAKQN
ncbi:substrate-binding domain-containing protein [Schaalia sp. ZJ405]|uniref:substrate-binding domain-containing protein n=1 Tax=Schaalia sp. ZJ405 TaxID=2709403 RepID=UPI0013EA8926|nr:substrate-binding domain-containing protein [Schaalia sp. ZJ405]QPK80941.1 substrate-binding domain-containing protein [Schaalia sp. ZJ405]